ncbi:unnamed protein product [Moneuplotes crassus]|uniref:Uncharacterized protein n=1 Tax=Euplotes crassus TaxID=5936 RepID=A0AAD2DB34_EUPCR|nr:unnamed protein product [Moneuplotes crassus]
MDYSDSEDSLLEMYSDSDQDSNAPNNHSQKCKSCGSTRFDRLNGSLICKICKTVNTLGNNVRVDFKTKMEAQKSKARIKKVKGKDSKDHTPVGDKKSKSHRIAKLVKLGDTSSPLIENYGCRIMDWTRQLFTNVCGSNEKKDEEKVQTISDHWVDYFLAITFGMLLCARQMRLAMGLSGQFERIVISMWLKYLKCWKNKPIIGPFTSERKGGLQMDKKKQIKRFTFFTQKQLEDYCQNLKETSGPEREDIKNKSYLNQVKQVYYELRIDEGEISRKRNKKANAKTCNNTLEFLKRNTICYNDHLYVDFKTPEDVLMLKNHPGIDILERGMIYIQRKYSVDFLIDNFKLDPVKLFRTIKYKGGKLLNIEDRTYTIQILSEIAEQIYTNLGVKKGLFLDKFISSRLRKRDKLVLLIFTIDLSHNEYLTDKQCQNVNYKKWLKRRVRSSLETEYQSLLSDQSQIKLVKQLAKQETKKIRFEKLLTKYLSFYYDSVETDSKTFKQQMSDIKVSKHDNQHDKLTSVEPNTVLNFLILGYFEYVAKNFNASVYSVNQILDCINQNKINYLNFGDNFVKILANSSLQVKHISSPLLVCRSLRYLLPQNVNSKLKGYFTVLCKQVCRARKITGVFQIFVIQYLLSQWDNFSQQTSFPFNSYELIIDCITKVYSLVYLTGVSMEDLNAIEPSKGRLEQECHFISKEKFDSNYIEGYNSQIKEKHEKSIPWEVKHYEHCSTDSILPILDTVQSHFSRSTVYSSRDTEIGDLFEEIMNFSDDEEDIPTLAQGGRVIDSDNSSIMSSDEEDHLVDNCNIVEVELSIS